MGKIIFPAQIGGVEQLLEILGKKDERTKYLEEMVTCRDEVVARLGDYADLKKLRAAEHTLTEERQSLERASLIIEASKADWAAQKATEDLDLANAKDLNDKTLVSLQSREKAVMAEEKEIREVRLNLENAQNAFTERQREDGVALSLREGAIGGREDCLRQVKEAIAGIGGV
jgi:multidrug resistance efflux pump